MKRLQSQSSCSPPCTTQCFIQQLFFCFVKKKSCPQGRRTVGMESGVVIRWSVFILLYDLKLFSCTRQPPPPKTSPPQKQNKQGNNKKGSRASLWPLPLFFLFRNPNCFQTCAQGLPALPGWLPSHETVHRHRLKCMHTQKRALILAGDCSVGSKIRTRHNPLSRSWTRLALPSALVGQKKHVENSPSEETWTETCLMSINTQAHDSVCNLKALCFMAESKVASVPQADRWLNIRVGPR